MASLPFLVLVADDDDELRHALAQVLEAGGFRVVSAVDGEDALQQLAQGETPCAILLDWWMPKLDGESFLKARAASEFLSSIPVFVLSATHVPADDPRVEGYLQKPFAVDALLSLLWSVCDAHCPASRPGVCLKLTASDP